MSEREPKHGYTSDGVPVHAHVHDHMETESRYQRFNKRTAVWLTRNVGTMTAFWLFLIASLMILPSTLHVMGTLPSSWGPFPSFMLTFGFQLLGTWLLSTVLELVLMPAIMVGQNLQNAAADARSAKTFDDVEEVKDRLDITTEGGITVIVKMNEEQLRLLKELNERIS